LRSSPQLDEARALLYRIFGHEDFRGLQAQVIEEALAGRNALAVLPTGGGKSVCYQIPSLMRPGLGIVVSPLIALMTDQVEGLRQAGVAAARLDSNIGLDERSDAWRKIGEGKLDLLYISPEGLMQEAMLERLAQHPIALIAIDEAHCVSQWGHDFRPEYRMLGRLAEVFPDAPRIAVTATADARTRQDIRAELRLEDAAEFVASFARPELQLSAERKKGRGRDRVVELVLERPGRSGVVYTGSRAGADEISEVLRDRGVHALAYHAGLDKTLREKRLKQFMDDEDAVIVATIAFGMGVDKPDVRYVIHADPPASIDAYWQEVGRAGRDGMPAEGITLYSASDMAFANRRIAERDLSQPVAQVQVRRLRQLYNMLDGATCRAAAVRRYFGETEVSSCGVCDLCTDPPRCIDVTQQAQKALSAVHRLGGRYGRGRVVDHILGKTKDVQPHEATLSTFGIGADWPLNGWRDLMEILMFEGLTAEDPNDGKPLVMLGDGEAVRAVYRGERRIWMREPAAPERSARAERSRGGKSGLAQPPEELRPLFDALRNWRRDRAAEQGVPPYVIFHDRTLLDIAARRPASLDQLAHCGGVGQSKLDRYGAEVLRVVSDN
jgi:ATP-dependent DNA helicase RecQ